MTLLSNILGELGIVGAPIRTNPEPCMASRCLASWPKPTFPWPPWPGLPSHRVLHDCLHHVTSCFLVFVLGVSAVMSGGLLVILEGHLHLLAPSANCPCLAAGPKSLLYLAELSKHASGCAPTWPKLSEVFRSCLAFLTRSSTCMCSGYCTNTGRHRTVWGSLMLLILDSIF